MWVLNEKIQIVKISKVLRIPFLKRLNQLITKHTDHFIYHSSQSLSTVTNNNKVSIIQITNLSQLSILSIVIVTNS